MGPLANERRLAAMQSIVQDARAKGAKVLTGGERIGTQGNFFAPTVLSHVPLDADVVVNEPFGPIAAVRSFENIEDAMAEANRLPFGLAGYAFTNSMKTMHQLSQRLDVGMLWVNQPAAPWPELPFGGVKDSGYGSEGGPRGAGGLPQQQDGLDLQRLTTMAVVRILVTGFEPFDGQSLNPSWEVARALHGLPLQSSQGSQGAQITAVQLPCVFATALPHFATGPGTAPSGHRAGTGPSRRAMRLLGGAGGHQCARRPHPRQCGGPAH